MEMPLIVETVPIPEGVWIRIIHYQRETCVQLRFKALQRFEGFAHCDTSNFRNTFVAIGKRAVPVSLGDRLWFSSVIPGKSRCFFSPSLQLVISLSHLPL